MERYDTLMVVEDDDGKLEFHQSEQYYAPDHVVGDIRSQTDWEGNTWGGRVHLVLAINLDDRSRPVTMVHNIRTDHDTRVEVAS